MHDLIASHQLEYVCVDTAPVNVESNNRSHLELAKLLLYFSDEPVVRKTTQSNGAPGQMCHEVYTFAHTHMSDGCKQRLATLHAHKHPHYHITYKELEKPSRSLQINLYYDPQSVMCCVNQFDTITQRKGFAFCLVNKKLVNELTEHDTPLIQVAQYNPIAYYRKTSCFLREKCVIL